MDMKTLNNVLKDITYIILFDDNSSLCCTLYGTQFLNFCLTYLFRKIEYRNQTCTDPEFVFPSALMVLIIHYTEKNLFTNLS